MLYLDLMILIEFFSSVSWLFFTQYMGSELDITGFASLVYLEFS